VDRHFYKGPERSAQRNFGVEHANAPYVLYLDADMRLSPAVIEECLAAVNTDPAITGIFIPEKVVGTGYWIDVRNFERSFYDATVVDAVRFIRRDVFLDLGGFDLSLCGPEDWDMDRRLGERGPLHLVSSPLFHNEGGFSFSTYLKKKSYYARTMDAYREKWQNDAIVRKQLGFYYRFIGVFVENGKWKRLIRHPLLAAGMYFLRFMVGCSYMLRGKKNNRDSTV
jgi:glycosyltransferase involved in cell wall biosynthesis